MSRRLVIAGAGGFGRGVHSWVSSSPSFLEVHGVSEVVFVDDHADPKSLGAPLVGGIADYEPTRVDVLLCAIGIVEIRQKIVEDLAARGATFATFVDDRAVLGRGVELGAGSIVCPGSVLSANVRVGAHVHVNFNCSVGHDTVIGDFATLSPNVNIMGEVQVGRASFLGGSATVLPRLALGERCVVGAGGVVTKSVDSGSTVVGVPAAPITRPFSGARGKAQR